MLVLGSAFRGTQTNTETMSWTFASIYVNDALKDQPKYNLFRFSSA